MPIVFSDHAKKQLRKRHISQKSIIETIRNPEQIIISYKMRKLRRHDMGGRMLQAVTITEGSKITVISGYYLKEKKEIL